MQPEPVVAVPPAYQLPAEVADALARAQLAGNVLVPSGVRLFASEGAARGASTDKSGKGAVAMRVVRDLGDVVEVQTGRVADCVEDFAAPYVLTLFVRRDRLVPRTQHEHVRSYADGTGVAIDAGAPVEITDKGPAWMDWELAALPLAPTDTRLGYAVPPRTRAAALPPIANGDRLVCDGTGAQTLDEWRAAKQAERDAKRREWEEQRRASEEAARAKWEAERPAREAAAARARKACRAKEAKAAKRKPKKPKIDSVLDAGMLAMSKCDIGFVIGSSFGAPGLTSDLLTRTHGARTELPPPSCGIARPFDDTSRRPAVPPKINGVAMPWPESRRAASQGVVRVGGKLLGDVEYGCGRARMAIAEPALSGGGVGYGSIGRRAQAQVQVWVPKAGPVTWPDGTPAGTYSGHTRYRDVAEIGDRLCVRVQSVAELVCHDKHAARTELADLSDLRD